MQMAEKPGWCMNADDCARVCEDGDGKKYYVFLGHSKQMINLITGYLSDAY